MTESVSRCTTDEQVSPPKKKNLRKAPRRTQSDSPSRCHKSLLTPLPRGRRNCDGSHTLFAQRLQVLFNSLFKVLFIFRSHYLFTIGLGAIFSLRRSTPAGLYSTLKLYDSWNQRGELDQRKLDWNGTIALRGRTFQIASSNFAGHPL